MQSKVNELARKKAKLYKKFNSEKHYKLNIIKRRELLGITDEVSTLVGSYFTNQLDKKIMEGKLNPIINTELFREGDPRCIEPMRMLVGAGGTNAGILDQECCDRRYRKMNGRTFTIRDSLLEKLVQTDIGRNVPLEYLRLPYDNIYLELGTDRTDRGLYIHDDRTGKHILEGAYLTESSRHYIDMANLSLGNELSLYKHLGIKPTDPMRVLYICFVGSPVGKGGGIDNDTYASFSIYLPENYKYSLEYLLKKHIEFYTEKENFEGAFAPLGKKTETIPEENLVLFGNSFNAIVASLLFLNSREPIFEETKEYTEAMAAANRKSPSKRRKYVESAMVKVNRTFVGDKSPSTSEGSTENEKRTISSHWRRGHYRTQRFGESNLKTKLIWIKPTIVTGGGAPDIKMKDYIV